MSIFQRRLASSTFALVRSFERRLASLERMIADLRNSAKAEADLERRQLKLDKKFDRKYVLDDATADEEAGGRGKEAKDEQEQEAVGGVLGWSLAELEEERREVQGLLEAARQVDAGPDQSKFDKLAELLRDERFRGEKVLIFTEFRDTLEFLQRRLEGLG